MILLTLGLYQPGSHMSRAVYYQAPIAVWSVLCDIAQHANPQAQLTLVLQVSPNEAQWVSAGRCGPVSGGVYQDTEGQPLTQWRFTSAGTVGVEQKGRWERAYVRVELVVAGEAVRTGVELEGVESSVLFVPRQRR